MPNAQVTYFLDRLQTLKNSASASSVDADRWRDEDLSDLTLEIMEYLGDTFDVRALERELAASSQIDLQALTDVKGWFEEIGREDPNAFEFTFPDGEVFDWKKPVERLNNLIESIQQPEGLEEIEIGLRLTMVGDAAMERLLMAVRPGHAVRNRVEQRLLPKLELLADPDAMAYWARLRAEVDPSREFRIPSDASIAPNEFFSVSDASTVRKRIAHYLADVRPRLLRSAINAGQMQWPAGSALVATVLAWIRVATTQARSTTDQIVIRSLGRISACTARIGSIDLAKALRLPANGFLVGGRASQEAKRSFDSLGKKQPPLQSVLDEFPKLLHVAELRSRVRSAPLERALRAYKLGLEVMAQDHHREMSGKREERLQREICRFLVERDILAYGTKFGWSETDIRGTDELGAAIIETKLLKRLPTTADINRWLTQLGSYMDQEHGPKAIRGVLLLFNFTSSSIFATEAALRAKYSVVVINLCAESPSKRKGSLEIAAAEGPGIVEILRLGVATPPRKTAKRKRLSRRR